MLGGIDVNDVNETHPEGIGAPNNKDTIHRQINDADDKAELKMRWW